MKTYETTDSQGNEIIVEDKTRIYLKLQNESERRCLGVINQGVLIVYRKRSIHLWKGSYGFNLFVLTTGKTFDKVKIVDEYGEYLLTVVDILAQGVKMKRRSRFEKQIYLDIQTIQKYALNKKVSI